jgi:hypothetical protein
MARRLGKEPIAKRRPTKGKRRPLGTDSFTDQARTQSMLTPSGFQRRTGIDIEQALKDLGPTIRNMALDDSNAELLVAWGRCAEKRLGMSLVIEDVIRASAPSDVVQWRRNICQAALGVWYNADERV